MSEDTLKQLYEDQRKELDFRRNREQQIFAWSATVQLALTGGALVSSNTDSVLSSLGATGTVLAAVAILAFTAYSVLWQLHQRKLLRTHQRVLAKLAVKRGWFDEKTADGSEPLIPASWTRWGSKEESFLAGSGKVSITCCLGMVAVAAVWLAAN